MRDRFASVAVQAGLDSDSLVGVVSATTAIRQVQLEEVAATEAAGFAAHRRTGRVRMIQKCALAIIAKRGLSVEGPTLSSVDSEEEDFLRRHALELRATVGNSHARGRFRAGSFLQADLERLLVADDREFLQIAERHASRLAAEMEKTSNAKACVLALLVELADDQSLEVSLLKLDAEIEAAEMRRDAGQLRLHVYQDLLPRPGEIQKGFSWPDPRSGSDVIVLDKNAAGSSTLYFRDAFEIDVSPKAVDTEAALVDAIASLPAPDRDSAVAAADPGGDAEEVVSRIRARVPGFAPTAAQLGGDGSLPGRIRPKFGVTAKRVFVADGIELKVPITALDRIESHREGDRWVTTITTDVRLIDTGGDDSVDPPF